MLNGAPWPEKCKWTLTSSSCSDKASEQMQPSPANAGTVPPLQYGNEVLSNLGQDAQHPPQRFSRAP